MYFELNFEISKQIDKNYDFSFGQPLPIFPFEVVQSMILYVSNVLFLSNKVTKKLFKKF